MNLVSMKKNYNEFSEYEEKWLSTAICAALQVYLRVLVQRKIHTRTRVYPWETSNSHSRVISVRVFHTSLPVQLVMPLSGSELKFEPELFRTGPKFGSKFRQLLDRTESPVRRSSRRVKCRTCSNSVRTEPYKIPSMKDNQQNRHDSSPTQDCCPFSRAVHRHRIDGFTASV